MIGRESARRVRAFRCLPVPRCFWAFLCVAGTARTCIASGTVPRLDHIVVIVMENHSYEEARQAPFLASLIASGTSFSNCHAEMHPSQPNYLALWSGSTQGVTNDACPPPGSPFTTPNLGTACEAAGLTWKAYSEDIPSPGFTGCSSRDKLYARKHDPWTNFGNVDHMNERPFDDFARDESRGALPNVAFVIPNTCNDSHNSDCPLSRGDAWLSGHVPEMLRAVGPRGLVIVTWDEDDYTSHNRILTTFNGPLVQQAHVSNRFLDHYGMLRTITDALGLAPFGMAANVAPITDVWLSEAIVKQERPTTAATLGPHLQ
jgi:acid phosphatase